RDDRLRAVDHAAGNQRSPHIPGNESGDDVGQRTVLSELVGAALRSRRPGALARADLRLAVAGLGLGSARDISLGCVASYRDPNLRENYVRYFVFRFVRETPSLRIRAGRFRLPRPQSPHD